MAFESEVQKRQQKVDAAIDELNDEYFVAICHGKAWIIHEAGGTYHRTTLKDMRNRYANRKWPNNRHDIPLVDFPGYWFQHQRRRELSDNDVPTEVQNMMTQ